jgi:hypothetical membrane protein
MKLEMKIFVASYILLIVTMFVLPFFSAEEYSIVKHTTSQLGAQKTPNSCIMNIIFASMGITSIWAGWVHYEGFWFQRILLLIFGISLILVAIYNHAPITEGLTFSDKSDKLHSLFASTTGFSFTILAISTAFIKEEKPEMILPLAIAVLAIILSLLIFKVEGFMGIWQRLMFISTFGWMIYEFKSK